MTKIKTARRQPAQQPAQQQVDQPAQQPPAQQPAPAQTVDKVAYWAAAASLAGGLIRGNICHATRSVAVAWRKQGWDRASFIAAGAANGANPGNLAIEWHYGLTTSTNVKQSVSRTPLEAADIQATMTARAAAAAAAAAAGQTDQTDQQTDQQPDQTDQTDTKAA